MRRIQFYPDKELEQRLNNRAQQLGIPVNQLVIDLLSSIDFDRKLPPQSFAISYADLKSNVAKYVKKYFSNKKNGVVDKNIKAEFLLRDIAGWNSVKQASYTGGNTTPNGKRMALGSTFKKAVERGGIENVEIATRIDRQGNKVQKLDENGVVIYRLVDDNSVDD